MPQTFVEIERIDLLTPPWPDYALIDSGAGQKLERFGELLLVRPAQQAVWEPRLDAGCWREAQAVFTRASSGRGSWDCRQPLPDSWPLALGDLKLNLRRTSSGHVGFFPEQQPCWERIRPHLAKPGSSPSLLNLFAYTGAMTLASAAAGARVCHLDASKPVVDWAAENARRSGLGEAPIRWIVEDVTRFARREERRGNRYDAIILDPPSFGRGPKKQLFKLENDLQSLLKSCFGILSEQPLFLLLSCHTPGITGAALGNLLRVLLDRHGGHLSAGELLLQGENGGHVLPSGAFALWEHKD